MLDNELRLITPVDPEGSIDEDMPSHAAAGRCYQLTHDYLVHALRDWLTRKQRETRQGRAELRLAERAAMWNAKPEDRYLPSAVEWLSIRSLTKPKGWTESQGRMMRRADWIIGLRGLGGAVLLAGLLVAGLMIRHRFIEANAETHAAGLMQQLLTAEIAEVPDIVHEIWAFRRWTYPELRRIVLEAPNRTKQKLHASLALLAFNDEPVDYLYNYLVPDKSPNTVVDSSEMAVLRVCLGPYRGMLLDRSWRDLRGARPGDNRILPLAGLLADYDATNRHWSEVADIVAGAMVGGSSTRKAGSMPCRASISTSWIP